MGFLKRTILNRIFLMLGIIVTELRKFEKTLFLPMVKYFPVIF